MEEVRLHEFGQAVRKGSIPALNEFLSRMLTLNAALIAACFAALKGEVLHPWACVAVVTVLFVSLVACLCGLYPKSGVIDFGSQTALADLESGTLRRKNYAMLVAGTSFVAAVLLAIVDLFLKVLR